MTRLTKGIVEKDKNTLFEEEEPQVFNFKLHNYTNAIIDMDSFMRDLEVSNRALYNELNDYIKDNKKKFQKSLIDDVKPKAKPKAKPKKKTSSSRSSSSSYSGGCGSTRSSGGCGYSSPSYGGWGGGCGSSSRSSGGC